jgi:hypothetical protein
MWFGLTWGELRRESGDGSLQPLGHALSTLIPGWNAVIAWRHFRAIDALLEKAGRPARVDATSAAIGLVIWWLTFTHYSSDPLFLALDTIELIAGTAVVVYGQRALNSFWESRGAEERVLETDLAALGVALVYSLFALASFFSAAP